MNVDTYIRRSTLLLEQAAATFEQYAGLHRAKGTPEGDEKAERNERHAARLREFLAEAQTGATAIGAVRTPAAQALHDQVGSKS